MKIPQVTHTGESNAKFCSRNGKVTLKLRSSSFKSDIFEFVLEYIVINSFGKWKKIEKMKKIEEKEKMDVF